LPLVHQAPLGPVDELDRVLQGDDVLLLGRVHEVDHGRQRGRLPRAGRPGDQHQPVLAEGQALDDVGEPELLERSDLGGDDPEDGPLAVPLVEHVDAEPGHVGDLDREVEVPVLLEQAPLVVVEDVVDHPVHLVPAQDAVVDRRQLAVEAHHRRRPRREVQVGAVALLGLDQKLGDVHGSLRSRSSRRSAGVRGSASSAPPGSRWRASTTPRVSASSGPRSSAVARWARALRSDANPMPPSTSAPRSACASAATATGGGRRSSTTTTSACCPSTVAAPPGNSPESSICRKPGTTKKALRSTVSVRRLGSSPSRARAQSASARARASGPATSTIPPAVSAAPERSTSAPSAARAAAVGRSSSTVGARPPWCTRTVTASPSRVGKNRSSSATSRPPRRVRTRASRGPGSLRSPASTRRRYVRGTSRSRERRVRSSSWSPIRVRTVTPSDRGSR